MTLAAGLFKQVAYKVEAIFGTPPAAAGAQLLRHDSSVINLGKETYQSTEIRTDYQISDYRHGVRRVKGSISADLSCKTFSDFFAAALKRDFAAVTPISSVAVTIAGTGPTWTVTIGTGSFLTSGFKVGDVVRLSVGVFNAANINKNLMITALTATVATVIVLNGTALVAEGPIATSTITVQGKKTWIPSTGHTDKSFSIEHWFNDAVQSEVYSGCKIDKIGINLPGTGMGKITCDIVGQNITTAQAQYFTTPTAPTTTGSLSAVNGILRVNATAVAIITGLSLSIDPAFSGDPVVGANIVPNLFPGTVNVTGQFTAYFLDATLRDAFINETEIDLYAAFTADNTAAADFLAFGIPRLKVGSADKNDGQGGIVQTFKFQALMNKNGGTGFSTELTTISVQDAQA